MTILSALSTVWLGPVLISKNTFVLDSLANRQQAEFQDVPIHGADYLWVFHYCVMGNTLFMHFQSKILDSIRLGHEVVDLANQDHLIARLFLSLK